MRITSIILACVFLGACQTTPDQVSKIETRAGGTVAVHTFKAKSPLATILMFEGAGGVFNPGGRGFVNSNYDAFVERGFTVVIMSPPADRNNFARFGGMHPRFRESAWHVRDIDAVVSMLRSKGPQPVLLLGISLGTKSVANYAANRSNKIDGVVFLSSSTRPPPAFKSVTDHRLSSITSPVLAIAHNADICSGTPPRGAREIANAAHNSVDAKAQFFDGGINAGRSPCGANSYHTFYGIEDDVVSAIISFIRKHAR